MTTAERRQRDLDAVLAIVRDRARQGLATTGRDVRDVLPVGNQTAHDRLRRLVALGMVKRIGTVGSRRGAPAGAYVPVTR